MQTKTNLHETELTLFDRCVIADYLGLANEEELGSSKLSVYKNAILAYCKSSKQNGALLRANDVFKENLQFFIDNYALNWLPDQEELCCL